MFMLDRFNRNISYVRISVTDRCNLRCLYCMPAEGTIPMQHSEILSFEEICEFVREVIPLGITKVRLTGGEPTVRKGIVRLVSMLSQIDGITDLAMTTNGILLSELAIPLRAAGLNRLNISLDTINADRYRTTTRIGNISRVLKGIEVAKKTGFENIKINSVRFKEMPAEENDALIHFCKTNNLELRFINQMNLKTGEFSVVEGGEGGNCSICNRIRLTANGYIKPCLFSDQEYSIREMGIREAVYQAIGNKPLTGTVSKTNEFYTIGG